MVGLLLAVIVFVAIVGAALAGVGYRGLYAALAVFTLVTGGCVIGLTPTPDQHLRVVASRDEAAIAGSDLLFEYGAGAATILLGAAFAGVLGALAFRAPR